MNTATHNNSSIIAETVHTVPVNSMSVKCQFQGQQVRLDYVVYVSIGSVWIQTGCSTCCAGVSRRVGVRRLIACTVAQA